MRDAAAKAMALLAGKPRSVLDDDETVALAVVRLLEIVGEAASQVSEPSRSNEGRRDDATVGPANDGITGHQKRFK